MGEKAPGESGEVYGSAGPTHGEPTRFRSSMGAGARGPGVPVVSTNQQDYARQTFGSRSDVGAGAEENIIPSEGPGKLFPDWPVSASHFRKGGA